MKTLNLKTATLKELQKLPHIGPVRAKKIQEKMKAPKYRDRINDRRELSKVAGLGDYKMDAIDAYLKANEITLEFK